MIELGAQWGLCCGGSDVWELLVGAFKFRPERNFPNMWRRCIFQEPLPEPNTCRGLFSLWLLGSFLARVSWELYLLNELDFSQTNKKYRNNMSQYCFVKHIYSSNTDTRRIYVPLLCSDGHLNNMGREVGLKGRMVGGTMRCPYKWLICPPIQIMPIYTSPPPQILAPRPNFSFIYNEIQIQFTIYNENTKLIKVTIMEMAGYRDSYKSSATYYTTQRVAKQLDFEVLIWTLMQYVCMMCVLRMHFPSDMESIRGSQAFKVSITMITGSKCEHNGNWYEQLRAVCKILEGGRKCVRKQLSNGFYWVALCSCCYGAAHFTWCARKIFSTGQARGHHSTGRRYCFTKKKY